MYYSTAATYAANGSTTPRKSSLSSSGYRLTAAAAISSNERYSRPQEAAAASHQPAAFHRTATPNNIASRHSSHHAHASVGSGHQRQYAADRNDSEHSHTVYRAPQMSPKEYETSTYYNTSNHQAQTRQGPSTRRTSSSVGPSAGRSQGAPPPQHTVAQRHSQHQLSSPPSQTSCSAAPQQPSLAGFCTQVSTTAPSSAHKAAKTTTNSNAASRRPSQDEVSTLVKNVPQYHDYASVRHPPQYYSESPLLPYVHAAHRGRHLLVLDLDETLVHASATPPATYDAAFNVDMETQIIKIYVKHRPYMMEFLRAAARNFEVCVFTASLSKYANQVLDHIDPRKELITHRLYREHCTEVDGSYTKDMSILGRPTENVVIVDNSPVAYMFFPNNAISCVSWFEDESDFELKTLIPRIEGIARAPTAMQGLHNRSQRRQLL